MNQAVAAKLKTYPKHVQARLKKLRAIIYAVAKEEQLGELEESLKWGEPAYQSPHGSTVRFDWKSKTPDEYAVYFNCKTRLVETFREVYPDEFCYVGNRALVLSLDDELPEAPLKHCLAMALNYHRIKHLPLLGA